MKLPRPRESLNCRAPKHESKYGVMLYNIIYMKQSFPDGLEWAYRIFKFPKKKISARNEITNTLLSFLWLPFKGGHVDPPPPETPSKHQRFFSTYPTGPPHFLKTCGSTAGDLISAFHNCLQHIGFPYPHPHQLKHKKKWK